MIERAKDYFDIPGRETRKVNSFKKGDHLPGDVNSLYEGTILDVYRFDKYVIVKYECACARGGIKKGDIRFLGWVKYREEDLSEFFYQVLHIFDSFDETLVSAIAEYHDAYDLPCYGPIPFAAMYFFRMIDLGKWSKDAVG